MASCGFGAACEDAGVSPTLGPPTPTPRFSEVHDDFNRTITTKSSKDRNCNSESERRRSISSSSEDSDSSRQTAPDVPHLRPPPRVLDKQLSAHTNTMATPYEVKHVPNKGYGLFATRALFPGTSILRERPAIIVRKDFFGNIDDGDIILAVDSLSLLQRQKFHALHEGSSGHPTREARIFHINAFTSPDGEHNYLYLDISRLNHSCVPNAADCEVSHDWRDGGEIKALKRIAQGEEITINYRPSTLSCLSRAQRQIFLQRTWEFDCGCEACFLGDEARELSDIRRKIICALRYKLYLNAPLPSIFLTTTDSGPLSVALAELFDAQTMENLKCTRNLGYHILLSRCLEAEGLLGDTVNYGYMFEAYGLVSLMVEEKDNVVLMGWARNAMRWMQKGLREWEETAPPELKIAIALERKACWEVCGVKEVYDVSKAIGSVMPGDYIEPKDSEVFAFRFTTSENGEPGVVCLTREQTMLFLYQQKVNAVLKEKARKQGKAFVNRWKFEEGGGLGSFVEEGDCGMS